MKLSPYSLTRLTAYERCPRFFYFRYVKGLPEIVESTGQFGSIVHEAIASALKGETPTLEGLPLEEIPRAKSMVDFAVEISKSLGLIRGIETRFAVNENFEFVDWDNAFLRGIIDLIVEDPLTESLQIWDWKTGRSRPSFYQLAFYSWVVERSLKRKVQRAGYILLSSRQRLEFEIDEEEIEYAVKKTYYLIQRIESDESWEPRPGNHCAYCSYVSMCPLVKEIKAKDIPVLRTPEEAKEVARLVLVMKQRLKRYKTLLREYLLMNGPLDIESGRWEIESKPRNVWPKGIDPRAIIPEALKLVESGVDPLKLFDLKLEALEMLGMTPETRESKLMKFKGGVEK